MREIERAGDTTYTTGNTPQTHTVQRESKYVQLLYIKHCLNPSIHSIRVLVNLQALWRVKLENDVSEMVHQSITS